MTLPKPVSRAAAERFGIVSGPSPFVNDDRGRASMRPRATIRSEPPRCHAPSPRALPGCPVGGRALLSAVSAARGGRPRGAGARARGAGAALGLASAYPRTSTSCSAPPRPWPDRGRGQRRALPDPGRRPGEPVPSRPDGLLDAVAAGTVEMGYVPATLGLAKDPTFALACALPFGLNARGQSAWWLQGGAGELFGEIFSKHGLVALPAGNTGAQMGGWFRREIKALADLQGLRLRIGGLGGQMLAKLGVVPQVIRGRRSTPPSRARPSTPPSGSAPTTTRSSGSRRSRRPTIIRASGKAARCSTSGSTRTPGTACPGLPRAPPGGRRPGPRRGAGRYDARNPRALRRLVAGGTTAPLPPDVMEAALKASNDLYAEIGRQERRLQARARGDEDLPERGVPLVPGGRIHLRQFHDPPPARGAEPPRRSAPLPGQEKKAARGAARSLGRKHQGGQQDRDAIAFPQCTICSSSRKLQAVRAAALSLLSPPGRMDVVCHQNVAASGGGPEASGARVPGRFASTSSLCLNESFRNTRACLAGAARRVRPVRTDAPPYLSTGFEADGFR